MKAIKLISTQLIKMKHLDSVVECIHD